jgi:hypothetical protein
MRTDWYYKTADGEFGPVAREHIETLARGGTLRPGDFVRLGANGLWLHPSDHFYSKTDAFTEARETERTAPEIPPPPGWDLWPPHPWTRYFAFTLEFTAFQIAACVVMFTLWTLIWGEPEMSVRIACGVVSLLLWMMAEAALIALFGTTPVKWLFGLRVQTIDGDTPTIAQAAGGRESNG